jgi:hypothetical protein
MPTDTLSEDSSIEKQPTAAVQANLLVSLNEWLSTLDKVLAGDIGQVQREELARGAAELRALVDGMMESKTTRDSNG